MNTEQVKTDLKNTIYIARQKLSKIEDKENQEKYKDLAGKCFVTRNNYSMPKTANDYWFLYFKVKKVKGQWVYVDKFQYDKKGRYEFVKHEVYSASLLLGYKQISEKRYKTELQRLLSQAAK